MREYHYCGPVASGGFVFLPQTPEWIILEEPNCNFLPKLLVLFHRFSLTDDYLFLECILKGPVSDVKLLP